MSVFEKLFSLKGKTALVTGGATGIGNMIATALVEAGASVIIASRKEEDCKKPSFRTRSFNSFL
ncbi:MAG: SDR family NAD(P)-dependent oxidoreductase [Methanosarcinales archaeon]|nr:SDR family NAD(P)-dependent oxidoreductase [Methanosarcinales archaeon]